jgi:alkanesulfonate monooxygenase SsuD/methylene tetrahydromethanopterin reductase-like flavin-dependent oxidoreductase (luciferase family)
MSADAPPTPPEFHFGLSASTFAGVHTLVEVARQAEQAGFDSVTVPDLPGALSPLIALAAVARATETIAVGTFVLNTGLWDPATVARELATLDHLAGGRIDITLGSGIPQPSLHGIIPPDRQSRFERLQATIAALKSSFDDPGISPGFTTRPRLRIAGTAERTLLLAADQADGFVIAQVPRSRRSNSRRVSWCFPNPSPQRRSWRGYAAMPGNDTTSSKSEPAPRSSSLATPAPKPNDLRPSTLTSHPNRSWPRRRS